MKYRHTHTHTHTHAQPIEKINKTKSWIFEKINKIDKTLVKTHQEKKGEGSN